MSHLLSEKAFISQALPPQPNIWSGDPDTDLYNLKLYEIVTFLIQTGAGGTGTAVIRVEESVSAAGGGFSNINFFYKLGNADGANLGPLIEGGPAGFTIGPAADQLAVVEVLATRSTDDHPFIRLTVTETLVFAVDGSILAICGGPSYAENVMPDATV